MSLSSLLRFITGVSVIPPMGLSNPIEIGYYSNTAKNTLPGAAVCSNKVFLPVCHMTEQDFFLAFKKALEFGSGFGRI